MKITKLPNYQIAKSGRGFSLIEMMIAIVILGLGLVMTATMFPVAWTRARSLTEYTTQRVIAQSAAATIEESLRPSGSSFSAFTQAGSDTGKYFLSSGSFAGDVFYDPVLHTDPILKAPCGAPNDCWTHRSVLIPSDTRVHALHMSNLRASGANTQEVPEQPFLIELMPPLCEMDQNPPVCNPSFPDGNYPAKCANPNPPVTGQPNGTRFCTRSFYSPQVDVAARMYPPMEEMPPNTANPAAIAAWLEKFNTHRYAWTALHRLRNYVGPDDEDVQRMFAAPPPSPAEKARFAEKAASAAGTTRIFDFYIVTLKRPQATSRYALQDSDPANVPDPISDSVQPVPVIARDAQEDVALPVAWRVQLEVPLSLRSANGLSTAPPDDDPTGVPTEVQVPPSSFSGSREMMVGMFPAGTQFVDEINGQVYRVVRRRLNATGNTAFLTLERELYWQDFDNSFAYGGDGQLQPGDVLRTVWVFPPPIAERTNDTTVHFDDSTPVIGIDVRTISMSPPG